MAFEESKGGEDANRDLLVLLISEGGTDLARLVVPKRYREGLLAAVKELTTLVHKNELYGDSWKRRGGAGAFLTMARPWDRLENMAGEFGWDVFAAGLAYDTEGDDDILDSINDLRNYLLLIYMEIVELRRQRE